MPKTSAVKPPSSGAPKRVRALLENGTDTSAHDIEGNTALTVAAFGRMRK